MGTRTEWFWGRILETLLQIGCVESNPGPNEGPGGSSSRKRYGSFDGRSKGDWPREELPREFVCWPWNWWCPRGDLPEEEEDLIQQTRTKRFDLEESSDDELLRDHIVSQEDIRTASSLPVPHHEGAFLRQKVSQLEQQLRREQQQRRCYEDKIEQLRQLYETARTAQLQQTEEQNAAQQQALRLKQLELQLQQTVQEKKRLEEDVLKETERRQHLEELFRTQILDKELQLRSHLEEEEIQRRRLQQDLVCEQEKRKSLENLLEKTELEKQNLQKRCNDLELQLDDARRRNAETEKELLLAQTSEQELQRELRDIRRYLNKIGKTSKVHSEAPPEEKLFRNDTDVSEQYAYSAEEIYWSVPENDGIFGDWKLTESQAMSKKQVNEELRNMLERAIEEKILLQRSLQKELTVRQQMQIRNKREMKLQRKLMQKEFRRELDRIEQLLHVESNCQHDETTEVVGDDDAQSTKSLSSISITSDTDVEENASMGEESEEVAQTESDIISDVIPETVDEDERQEIRQLLLEELQRLQARVKEDQELKRQGRLQPEDGSYREGNKQKIPSSEISDNYSEDLEKEKILGENIEAILRKHPLKSESEEIFNDDSISKTSENEILAREYMLEEVAPLTITNVETNSHILANAPFTPFQNIPSTESEVETSTLTPQSSQDQLLRYNNIDTNTINEEKCNKTSKESDALVTELLLKHSKQELNKAFGSDNEENLDSYCQSLKRDFISEEVDKSCGVKVTEFDGLNEQIVSRRRTLKRPGFTKPYVTDRACQELFDTSVTFQGHLVCLRALLGGKDPDYDLERLLRSHSEEGIVLSSLPSTFQNNQIRRSVQRTIYLKEDILKNKFSKLRTTFAISGASNEELQALIPPGESVEQLTCSGIESSARTFVILNASTAENDYEELCAKAKNFRDIHWFHKDLGQGILIWKKSKSNIKYIRPYIDKHRNNAYSSLADVNEKCSVVSASCGEGVSTFLAQLVVDFKERDPTYWILKMGLSKMKKGIMESCTTQEHILEILWESNGTNSDLERKLFEHYFYQTGKIILLLEDVHKNITGFRKFLKLLLETKLCRIIITVHPQWQDLIEDRISNLAFKLTPLNESEQKKILIQRWDVSDRYQKSVEDFSVAVLRAATLGNLILTPLNLILLADNYKVPLENYLSKSHVEVPTLIDEKVLYERYLEIYFEKEFFGNNGHFEDDLREKYFNSATYHALIQLFPEQNSVFDFSEEDSGAYKLKGKALHCCVAEYLCAKWFEKHFEEYRYLIRDNYFNEKLKGLWFLFDKLLAEDSELHKAALYGNVSRVEKLIDTGSDIHKLDRGGRKAFHIASIHGQVSVVKLLIQKMEKQSAGKDKILKWTPLRYADESGNWEVVELFLEAGECPSDIEKARESFHNESAFQTIITKAASAGYKHLLRSLLSISEFSVNATLRSGTYSYQKYTLLHIAAENGHSEIVDYLMRMPAVRTDLGSWDGSTPLHLAARHGHTEAVRRLISRTDSIVFNKQGDTPLHETVRNGHVNVATVLLAEGDADPNSRNVAGDYPLHIACSNGDITFVSLLLDYGAEKNVLNGNGNTPLDCAIRGGQSTVVRYLVEKCGKDIVIGAVEGNCSAKDTPLHVAARMGDTLSMEYLLRAVDSDTINTPNDGGDTPLHSAALYGGSSMVEYLISKCGANPARTNKYGNTALHLAVVREDYSTVRVLLAHSPVLKDITNCEGNLPLHLAARRGNLQMTRCLLQHDLDKHTVGVKNREMKTPLQVAAERNDVDVDVIKILVESGSDVNVRDRHGNTLLHQAVSAARADIAKLVLDTGLAITELRNSSGYTALLSAVKTGQSNMIAVLAKGGADVNVRTSDGNTALHVATVAGNPETVTALLQLGAFPDARNAEGNTALHRAVYLNKVDMVRLLVEFGADKNSKNMREQSPRDLAIHLNTKEDILRYL